MLEEQKKIEFIVCPACNGSGKNKIGLDCANCAGMGLGAFRRGVFYYWGPKLGAAVIKLSHLRNKINRLINIFSFLIGIFGFLSLGFWVWQNSLDSFNSLLFWRIKHPLILAFWISLIFDMFIFYRLSEESASEQKIKKNTYEERNKSVQTPNNWKELKKAKYKVDVSRGYDAQALDIAEEAYLLAKSFNHTEVNIKHLFFSLFKSNIVITFFSRMGIDQLKLLKKIKSSIITIPGQGRTEISNKVKEVLIEGYLSAYFFGKKKAEALDLILPCQAHDEALSEILYDTKVDKDKIENCLAWFRINDKILENYRRYRKMARYKPSTTMDKAYTAVATPVLNHFAYDLTIASKWGRLEFAVNREQEIEEIFQRLESGHKGAILSGEVGVGKNTIIEGIAQLMVEENVPRILRDKRLVKLDVARLVSGVDSSAAQERLLVIIDEVARARNIILYIQNIENIIGITAGREESLDLAEVLASAIEQGRIYCLATATSQNYSKYIEDSPLGNAMSHIKVKEPVGNQAIQIVESKIGNLEAKNKVYFSYNAIENAIKLSSRYMHDKYLPAKAVELLELVSVKVAQSKGEKTLVSENDVANIVSEITSIPVSEITEKESDLLLNLEEKIHLRMIDQEEAVNMVAASLRRARTELSENKRPIASFLFLGPTGVGKTELAKSVAEVYFGNEKNMIRIDMSEYQQPDSINKMIGSAEGVKGYLTEAVRKSPFSLVLLDEFEKAHSDILNLFLQVMDDGRLTDGQGKTIDFTNAIIIATSNADAVFIQDEVARGADIKEIKNILINERLNKLIRPELINRFDGIIVFKPLSEDDIVEIAKLMISKVGKMLENKGIRLKAEEEGIRILARQGYDPKFGARPLRRLLQDKVENIIANKILTGELERRDIVVIDSEANIRVEKAKIL